MNEAHCNSENGSQSGSDHDATEPAEGVIRFRYTLAPGAAPLDAELRELRAAHEAGLSLGLLGRDPGRYEGFAYGNLSLRTAEGFWVTASQRIDVPTLQAEDLVLIRAMSSGGKVQAEGARAPSSETLTHGAVHAVVPKDRPLAVFHGHSPALWERPLRSPWVTTPPEAANGTHALADAIGAIASASPESGWVTMLGHRDGFLAWGEDFDGILATLHRELAGDQGRP